MTENSVKTPFITRLFTTNEGVAQLSIAAVSVLIIIKVAASIITGSLGIRADAIHSIIDLSGAIIGLVGIIIAKRPPDDKHNYGHTKAENIAALFISLMIFAAAGSILYEAVLRIIEGGSVQMLAVGIWVTVAAIFINIGIALLAIRTAKKTKSMALEAQGQHMMADVFSSVAVLVGLLLVTIFKLDVLDSIAGVVVAFLIGKTAWEIFSKAIDELMDKRLPKHDLNKIQRVIDTFSKEIVGITKLRTRLSVGQSFIELTLTVPLYLTIAEAHAISDRVEEALVVKIPNSQVIIHCEPCAEECDTCTVDCQIERRKHAAKGIKHSKESG
jgi:cation diffusion facilitator family transporter